MTDFIDQLPVSDDERAKLEALGVKTPFALLSLRKASTRAFDDHFGKERADAIAGQLLGRLSDAERRQLDEPVRPAGRLGGRLEPPPHGSEGT